MSVTSRPKALSTPGTVGNHMLSVAKYISSVTDIPSNALVHQFFGDNKVLFKTAVPSIVKKMASLGYTDTVIVKNIPKEDRPNGNCYHNALVEHCQTKNECVVGLTLYGQNNGYGSLVCHAFNYDKKKNIYYDTTSDSPMNSCDRLAFILMRGSELMDWYLKWHEDWRSVPGFSSTYGGYDFVIFKEKLIIVKTMGIDCPRLGMKKEYCSLTVENL